MMVPIRSHLAQHSPEIPRRPADGFSLIELLVVIAVLAILASLLLPALSAAREAARQTTCTDHLRQLGIGLQSFHAAEQSFPAGSTGTRLFQSADRRQLAWSAFLLPYLEQRSVWDQLDPSDDFDSRRNQAAGAISIPLYLCPSTDQHLSRAGLVTGDLNENGQWDPGEGLAYIDYGGMFGVGKPDPYPFMNGVLIYDQRISAREITDGLSHTMIVAEDAGRGAAEHGEWINGQNIFDQTGPVNQIRNNEIYSDHPAGAHVVMCDGHVVFLDETVETGLIFAMCTRGQEDHE